MFSRDAASFIFSAKNNGKLRASRFDLLVYISIRRIEVFGDGDGCKNHAQY